ncbi:MAG: threonyl-tRNA synthetase [Patescibacteria group bacterium]|nr:threonyl-tRNA synthetase [Patescibacteria group bacterium]
MENDNLSKKRHTLAHLLAQAVLEHYPSALPTLGPAIDNGFYYDFDFGAEKLGDEDLKKIQKSMRKNLNRWTEFSHREVSTEEAKSIFTGNQYKLELITEIASKGETITLYTCGGFEDLCRGGHSENPFKEIPSDSFKITHQAGAYWRGDEKNKMLTRIYGLAFETEADLKDYEKQIEEAKKRDHRKIGAELDLFTFSDLVGPGLPLFTPKGTLVRDLIIEKIQSIQKRFGYQKVTIPHITKAELYKTSGHYDKYGDDLFKVKGRGDTEFCMKPMNCPHHTQIFASNQRSYKDLPLRYVETTTVYRDEQAGELMGLSRVRAISQDDGHIFCRPDQIQEEVKNIISIIKEFYTQLGMLVEGRYWVSLSVRDPQNLDKYIGDENIWNTAEKTLEDICKTENLNYKRVEGEAAFYGPKIDFQFKDALGREWQLGTAQLDFNMPTRFGLEYTDKDGEKKTPVMIHRAIAGSLERFMALAIEHFAGAFPVWMSPVQVAVVPVNTDAHGEYAKEVFETLKNADVRAELYDENESLGKRVRQIKTQKIPFTLVIGDKEKESGKLTAEGRNDEKHENLLVDEVINLIKK